MMNIKVFFALTLLLAFLQGTLLPLVFLEILLLFWLAWSLPQQALAAAFFSGIIFDLVQAQTLGVSSLLFVLFVLLVSLFSEKMPVRHPIFLALLGGGMAILRMEVLASERHLLIALLVGLVSALLFGRSQEVAGRLRIGA